MEKRRDTRAWKLLAPCYGLLTFPRSLYAAACRKDFWRQWCLAHDLPLTHPILFGAGYLLPQVNWKKKKTEKYAGLAKYTYLKKEKIRWHKALMQCQIVRKSFQRVVWLCAWMIACPQFKNSFVLNYKGFFYGKEVRKAQPFSGMLWFAWDFGHPPLKFVFCQCKGCPTLRGTHATSIFGKYLFGRLFEI